MFSKLNSEALKSKKTYINSASDWCCYWHLLSGDELKNQVFTVAHKPSDKVYSFSYSELSGLYKLKGVEGVEKNIEALFATENVTDAVNSSLQFLNDARIEYLGKPLIENITNAISN